MLTSQTKIGRVFFKALLNSSFFFPLQEEEYSKWVKKSKGLCFSYVFCLIIISRVLHKCPKSLLPEVMVSGLDLKFLECLFCSRNIQYYP